MRVAITGGTGFVGQKLLERLQERGDSIRLLSRRPAYLTQWTDIEHCPCDLLKIGVKELVPMLEDVDVLYHCAGQITDTQSMKALHVNATHKLVKAASGRIGHWVQLSSVGVYGAVRVGCVTEDSAVCPEGHYETTKAESDQIVMNGAESGGFSCSILRPSNVFGADMTNQSLFGLIRMIDRGLFFYVGELGASANYIHVNNVIEGLIRCGTMDAARGRIFNLSDFRTIEQFTESVAYALGRSAPRLRIPSAVAHLIGQTVGRVPRFPLTASRVAALENRVQYSIEHIQQVLQYSPIISMEQGIDELVAAYQQKNAH